jgi:hypothetical protein
MVNGRGIVFKGHKTRGASVPLVCGRIGKYVIHRGVPMVNGLGKHWKYLILYWDANQGR